MQLLVMVGYNIHDAALEHASKLGRGPQPGAGYLPAPANEEVAAWINKIWGKVEAALREATRSGIEMARPLIDAVSEQLAKLNSEFSRHAKEVRTVITARLSDYLQETIDGAIARVRPTLSVAGRELTLSKITVEQRLEFSGSLKASLETLCEFIAAGELTLTAEYGTRD